MSIEKLLRMVADYHNFCNMDAAESAQTSEDELTLDELDFIAAATGISEYEHKQKLAEKDQL